VDQAGAPPAGRRRFKTRRGRRGRPVMSAGDWGVRLCPPPPPARGRCRRRFTHLRHSPAVVRMIEEMMALWAPPRARCRAPPHRRVTVRTWNVVPRFHRKFIFAQTWALRYLGMGIGAPPAGRRRFKCRRGRPRAAAGEREDLSARSVALAGYGRDRRPAATGAAPDGSPTSGTTPGNRSAGKLANGGAEGTS
jgi:hypothetical protein